MEESIPYFSSVVIGLADGVVMLVMGVAGMVIAAVVLVIDGIGLEIGVVGLVRGKIGLVVTSAAIMAVSIAITAMSIPIFAWERSYALSTAWLSRAAAGAGGWAVLPSASYKHRRPTFVVASAWVKSSNGHDGMNSFAVEPAAVCASHKARY